MFGWSIVIQTPSISLKCWLSMVGQGLFLKSSFLVKNDTFPKFSLKANISCDWKNSKFSFSNYVVQGTKCLSAKFHGCSLFGFKDMGSVRFSRIYALRLSLLIPYNFLYQFFEVLINYILINWNTFQLKVFLNDSEKC